MRIAELDHVALHVKDLEASCKFYREVLRLDPLPRPAFNFPGAWFRLGERHELHLIGERTIPVVSHRQGNHFAVRAENLDEWEQHFKRIGFTPLVRKLRPDGAGQIFLEDPDGHIIELSEKNQLKAAAK